MTDREMWAPDRRPTAPQPTEATCTDCGGPLDPGRVARCVACVSAEWIALEERYGREWAARHRGT